MSVDDKSPADLQVEIIEALTNPESDSSKATLENYDYLTFQKYLGMQVPSMDEKDKMQYIWEFFKKENRGETLKSIREAQRKLAPPQLGDSPLNQLYSYTKLMADSRDINSELEAYQK